MSRAWWALVLALDPCDEAVAWIAGLPDDTSYEAAWALCERGDWMLWLVGRCEPVASSAPWSTARRPLVAAAAGCARLALPVYETQYPGDDRVRRCVETTEAWTRREASVDEVRVARRAAYDAADAADAAASAADAADAAAFDADAAAFDAAHAAFGAANAAFGAAHAADAAASAASAASAYAAAADVERARVLRGCADIVRRHFPSPPVLP